MQILKRFLLPFAILLGVLLPDLTEWASLIPFLLGGMLFLAFLGMEFGDWRQSGAMVLRILPWWILLAPLLYFILHFLLPQHPEFAYAAWLILWAPTASAAAGVTRLYGGNPLPVAMNMLLQHGLILLLVPLWFVGLPGTSHPQFLHLATQNAMLIIIPLGLALALRKWLSNAHLFTLRKAGAWGIWLWAMAAVLVVSRASTQIQKMLEQGTPIGLVIGIAILALVLCVALFMGGKWIAPPQFREEGSQMLGQKNTVLAIWIGNAWLDPTSALGPTFYVIWQNLWLGFRRPKH